VNELLNDASEIVEVSLELFVDAAVFESPTASPTPKAIKRVQQPNIPIKMAAILRLRFLFFSGSSLKNNLINYYSK
jgi:hypothetical protein